MWPVLSFFKYTRGHENITLLNTIISIYRKIFQDDEYKAISSISKFAFGIFAQFFKDMENFCNFDFKEKVCITRSTCCFYKTLLRNGSIKNWGWRMQILHAKVFKHKRSYEIFSHIYIQIFLKIYNIYLQQYILRQFGHGICI